VFGSRVKGPLMHVSKGPALALDKLAEYLDAQPSRMANLAMSRDN